MAKKKLQRMKIVDMPLSVLLTKKWPTNPKKHRLDVIDELFDEVGFVDPVGFDERSQRIVEGHGRVECLEKRRTEGKAPPRGIRVRGHEWYVPTIRGNDFQTEKKASKFVVGANRSTELGGWNEKLTTTHMRTIVDRDRNIAKALHGTGYTERDYARMIKATSDKPVKQPKRELKVEPKFQIVVNCANAKEQRSLLAQLTKDGYNARMVKRLVLPS